LGWPIFLSDLQLLDDMYFQSLSQLVDLANDGHDVSSLYLNFTTTELAAGATTTIELVERGSELSLTNENVSEYLEASLRYRVFSRVKPQLTELLLGFIDVVSEPLLTVFDVREFDLLMCGSHMIDLDDWKKHTDYEGEFLSARSRHQSCEWFWEFVENLDNTMKRRLLKFATGSSGVPGRGFEFLQSNDGKLCKFTLLGIATDDLNPYPVSQ
jgi:E3 ubiquitin-protein ligase NEDD4